jgi:hypothetical protein
MAFTRSSCRQSVISRENQRHPDLTLKFDANCRFAIVIDQRTAPRLAVEQRLADRIGRPAVIEIGGNQKTAERKSLPSERCSAGTGVWPSKNATS